MWKALQMLIFLMVLCAHHHYVLGDGVWDYAVTAKTKIIFYNEHWREVTSSAHQFDHLSAIAFDETEEIVYFADRVHNNGSIFSLKLSHGGSSDDNHIIDTIVQKTQNETITSIAYDPLDRNLYWVDQKGRKIYYTSVDRVELKEPKILMDFANEDTLPDGIAIDFCRRKLYWTNSNFTNATIERIDLDGNNRKVIVDKDLWLPHGIVVDQLADRIYWVVDQQGIHYTVESANLDGTERTVVVKGMHSTPSNLAVTKDLIYWTDERNEAILSHTKVVSEKSVNHTEKEIEEASLPRMILRLQDKPSGIIARSRYMTNLQKDDHCSSVINKITRRLLDSKPISMDNEISAGVDLPKRDYCLNDGIYIEQSGICICKVGFVGARCETNECHNYCIHGTCTMSSTGQQKCSCQRGFYGRRCQSSKCSGYCLNEGECKIDSNGEPTCECSDNFGGQRCDQNSTEICSLFCRVLKYEPDTYVPFGCHDICEELSSQSDEAARLYAIPTYKHLEVCKDPMTWTNTIVIALVAGVVLCLCLVLLIVHGVRRFYKPARPRIKKTFVVRRQPASSSDTPLTNRPIATEQCEITIENCCNMNYCDTPCFDPKMVQQTLSRDSNTKEDKKVLIHNIEDDLY
ncbi:low-density lipoprotein receptor repeat domain-containing protein cueball [Haematobia irritans]|uniref:low-density lipoprotein receptor repeat domain-containing protein cueball n=1 Tax=Haematobia irritans TaxID=7368 RepID=UPI003F4F6F1E